MSHRPSEHVATGPTSSGASSATPTNTREEARSDELQRRAARCEQTRRRARCIRARRRRSRSTMRRRGSGWVSGSASRERLDRARSSCRASCRERVAAITVTIVPTSTAMMKRARQQRDAAVAAEPKTESSSLGDEDADHEAEDRRDEPGERRLDEHRPSAPARASHRARAATPAPACAARRGC